MDKWIGKVIAVARHHFETTFEMDWCSREAFVDRFPESCKQEAMDCYDDAWPEARILMRIEKTVMDSLRCLDDKVESAVARIEVMLSIENKTVLTVSEAAKLANVSPLTVRRWLEKRILRGSKSDDHQQARWFIRKRDLTQFLNSRVNQGRMNV